MTLAEAIASVVGGLGWALGSPIAVAFYAVFMFFFAVGLAVAATQIDMHWLARAVAWALSVLSVLFATSLVVWVTSSTSPLTWGAV